MATLLLAVVGATLLVLVSALPASAEQKGQKPHPTPAITVSYETRALSAVGRETDITITSSGRRSLHIYSITETMDQTSFKLSNSSTKVRLAPGKTYTFTIGWSGGPGGSTGPTVTIVSNAPTSPTVITIPYQ